MTSCTCHCVQALGLLNAAGGKACRYCLMRSDSDSRTVTRSANVSMARAPLLVSRQSASSTVVWLHDSACQSQKEARFLHSRCQDTPEMAKYSGLFSVAL